MPSLSELGTFFGTIGTAIAVDYRALNPPSIPIPKTQNLPQQSGTLMGGNNMNQIIIIIVVAVAALIGLRMLKR